MLQSWGIEDRWGDYELLFGAAKFNLKTPIFAVALSGTHLRFNKDDKIFRNGLIMLKMCWTGSGS